MFRALLTAALLFTLGAAQAQSLATRDLGTSVTRNVLSLNQDVRLSGQMTWAASIGPLTTSSAGFGAQKNAVKLPRYPVNLLPAVSVASPTSQDTALQAAKDWMDAQIPSLRSQVADYMRGQGLSSAFYLYTQEITVTTETGAKKRAISFNLSVDQNGRALYGAPKIVDPEPTILEALYTPKRAVDGLPTHWAYPGAGGIKYRLLNRLFEPISEYQTEDTGGAFDEDTEASDPDSKLRCLIDLRHPGCAGPLDIRKLMDRTGASYAILDYVRRLEPDYEELADGTQQARGAISYDARIWNCSTYKNSGFFGYVLTMRAERYLVQPAPDLMKFQMLQQFGGKTISPTEPFHKTVEISALGGRHPDTVVISPHPDDNTIWLRSDADLMRNVIYVAPVRAQGGDGEIPGAAFSGDMAVREDYSSGGVREYYIGTVADNYWRTGQYDRTVSFNLKDPRALEEFALIQEGFDDWMLVAVNGTTVFVGPYGGDMLSVEFTAPRTEMDCTQEGSKWACYSTQSFPSGGSVPPGCTLVGGGSEGGFMLRCKTAEYAQCVANFTNNESQGFEGYRCSNSVCGYGAVQYRSNATGRGAGCGDVELETSWVQNTYVDLRPYLQNGANTIFMRTIVGGDGEGWIRVRTRSCGASLGLDQGDPPPVPSDAGAGGVTDTVGDLAEKP